MIQKNKNAENSPDFTLDKYQDLCSALISNAYLPLTICSYIKEKKDPDKNYVIMRHDVDMNCISALSMAIMESDMGFVTSYYFRYPYTFDRSIIKKIGELGHEIGYHYEVLSKTQGDHARAIDLFKNELSEFTRLVPINTVCMHGSPLSKYDNRNLWEKYSLKDLGILGEAYISINDDIAYYSDTGRTWSKKNKIRDFHKSLDNHSDISTTDDIINIIKTKSLKNLYLVAHPERWASTYADWVFSNFKDWSFNMGKRYLKKVGYYNK
jgi:hypothetical protein